MDSAQAVQQVVEEALSHSIGNENQFNGFNHLLGNEQVAGWIGSQVIGFLSSGNGRHLIADLQNVMDYLEGAMTRYSELTERNAELAAALGACACWGEHEDCETCHGEGASGWLTPNQESFSELVLPTLLSMSRTVKPKIRHNR